MAQLGACLAHHSIAFHAVSLVSYWCHHSSQRHPGTGWDSKMTAHYKRILENKRIELYSCYMYNNYIDPTLVPR